LENCIHKNLKFLLFVTNPPSPLTKQEKRQTAKKNNI
jgi:hypothetical protein